MRFVLEHRSVCSSNDSTHLRHSDEQGSGGPQRIHSAGGDGAFSDPSQNKQNADGFKPVGVLERRPIRKPIAAAWLPVLSLALAACGSEPVGELPRAPRASSLSTRWAGAAPLPFDAGRVVRRVQHAWKEGSALDPRYEARLVDGALRFLPGRRLEGEAVERAPQPVEIRTTRVAVAGEPLFGEGRGAGAFVASGAAVERPLAPGLVERFEAGDGVIEQSWRVDRLARRGALVIDIAVSGAPWIKEGPGGHLFGAPTSTALVSYSGAKVRDVAGLEIAVRAERTAGGLRLRVPGSFVAAARLPLTVDPTIGSEFSMDTALARNSAEDQTYPRAATSGTEYLVVWQDYRQLDGRYHIYGARVTSAGVLQDPTGIEISQTPNSQNYPDVAYGGGTYLVVWQESGSSPSTSSSDIYGTRVSTAGVVQDTSGIKINGATGAQARARVEYGGGQFLAVWDTGGTDVMGARVSTAGVVQDTTGITISAATGNQTYPDVAALGSTFLVVWNDTRGSSTTGTDIYGARVDSTGTLLDASGIAISTASDTQEYASVASNGTNWLVAWEDRRNYNYTYWDLYAARVESSGTVDETTGLKVSGWNGDETAARVSSDGTDYLVVWTDGTTVISGTVGGARIKSDGTLVDTTGFSVAASGQSDLVYNATTTYYFIPRYGTGLSNDVFSRRIQGDGTAVDTSDLSVSTAYNAQYYPSAAFDGTNYFLVWADTRNWATTGFDIYGTRVDTSGTVLDTSGVALCTASGTQSYPAIAFDGTNYLVVWEDRRSGSSVADIFGGRVKPDGTLLDGNGNQFTGAVYEQRYPRVAFDANANYLVVWQDYRDYYNTTSNGTDIYGTRVRASDGKALEQLSGIAISTQTTNENEPDVAFDGTNFVVVWSDNRNSSASGYDIYAARLDQSGAVLDASGQVISSATGDQVAPSLLFNGTSYFAAWQDSRTSSTAPDIYGGYFTTALVPGAAFALYSASGSQYRPRVAMVGKAPFVVFEDSSGFNTSRYDIRGVRVGASSVLESFAVSSDSANEIRPVVATGSGAQGLAAYMHYDTSLMTVRVVARLVNETCSTTTVCPPGTTCSGGYCVLLPDASVPDSVIPDSRAPDSRAPDSRAPDSSVLDLYIPDLPAKADVSIAPDSARDVGKPAEGAPHTEAAPPADSAAADSAAKSDAAATSDRGVASGDSGQVSLETGAKHDGGRTDAGSLLLVGSGGCGCDLGRAQAASEGRDDLPLASCSLLILGLLVLARRRS
jgi:hypothetical protein